MSEGNVFTAAAVQAAPVYLNRDATVAKACTLIRQAGGAGARLIAFPEVFIPGFPHWIYLDRPQANNACRNECWARPGDLRVALIATWRPPGDS